MGEPGGRVTSSLPQQLRPDKITTPPLLYVLYSLYATGTPSPPHQQERPPSPPLHRRGVSNQHFSFFLAKQIVFSVREKEWVWEGAICRGGESGWVTSATRKTIIVIRIPAEEGRLKSVVGGWCAPLWSIRYSGMLMTGLYNIIIRANCHELCDTHLHLAFDKSRCDLTAPGGG